MVTTQLRTASDLWNLGEGLEDFELIEGELAPMTPPGGEHGEIQANLIIALGQVVPRTISGKVFGDVGYVLQRDPDTVLAPDLTFISASRLPDERTGFLNIPPDLAVEIVSPSNSPGEIERKLAIYLQAGVRSVWIVYPKERQVMVHTPGNAPRNFKETDELVGEPVLPGLVIPVSSIFE